MGREEGREGGRRMIKVRRGRSGSYIKDEKRSSQEENVPVIVQVGIRARSEKTAAVHLRTGRTARVGGVDGGGH